MNLTDDIAVDPAIEAAYRRGYYQGAEAITDQMELGYRQGRFLADGLTLAQLLWWQNHRLKRWAHDQSTMSRRVLPPRPGGGT